MVATQQQRPLGAHTSIAGGLSKAVDRAIEIGATALQIFTRNQVRWTSPPLKSSEAAAFRQAVAASGIQFVCAHSSYLINLASSTLKTRQRSLLALQEETNRAGQLGCHCLVMHPGSPRDDGCEAGIERVAAGVASVLEATEGLKVRIALENTAGQGASLGSDINQLAAIAERAGWPKRLGICLDTAHAFAAGYDLRHKAVINRLVDEIAAAFGVDRLYLMHLNDCRTELGSRSDRHADIGKGMIGAAGFRNLLGHSKLINIPGIIETPKGDDTKTADRANLARLAGILAS